MALKSRALAGTARSMRCPATFFPSGIGRRMSVLRTPLGGPKIVRLAASSGDNTLPGGHGAEGSGWPAWEAAANTAPGPAPAAPASAERAMEQVLYACTSRRLELLLPYVPEDMLELARRRQLGLVAQAAAREPGASFSAVLDEMLLTTPEHHFLDSYALRHLVLGKPARIEPLSGLRVGAAHYVERCAVVAPSGEECVLTFSLTRRWGAHACAVGSRRGPLPSSGLMPCVCPVAWWC
jgi:hypothetical protein